MWTQHLPEPQLQFKVYDEDGSLVGITDFAWPEFGLLGEFDGKIKYGRLLKEGETASDAVVREKEREDRIREVTRWLMIRYVWRDLYQPEATAARTRRLMRDSESRLTGHRSPRKPPLPTRCNTVGSDGFTGYPVKPPPPVTAGESQSQPGRLRSTPKATTAPRRSQIVQGGREVERGAGWPVGAQDPGEPREDQVGHRDHRHRVAGQCAGDVAVQQVVDAAQGAASGAVRDRSSPGRGRSGSGRARSGRLRRAPLPAARPAAVTATTGNASRHRGDPVGARRWARAMS